MTGTFAGSVSSAGTSTTLTVAATTTASVATSNFTVTGTADNGLTRTVSGSVTVKARQPTSFSISPSEVGIGECYTISAGNAANMTLDLQYSKDGGTTQTITGWPTLDEDGRAKACPTLESQVGSYRFTGYRNTQASTWLTSNVSLVVVKRDFSVAVSPASRNVYRDGTGTYTVTVSSINSFSSPVTLSVSGLPTGVTGAFDTNPVTPAGTSTLTLTAGAAATLGEDEFTVTGTGGGLTRTGTAEVVVPHFMLSVSPDTGNLDRGSSRTYTVEVTPQNGFSMPVALSVSGLGTGLTGSFSRNQVMPPNWTSTLTIDADCSAATTEDEFTVTGSGGGYTATDTDEVTPRRFTVAVTPATADLQRGSSVRYQVTANRDEGFSSNVTLSASSLPSGVTGKFSTNPTGSTSRLTLTANSTAALGKDEFTVTGTAHGCTAAAMADVVVTDPPRFNVTMTPETGNVDRGSSRTYTVTVKPDTGFTSNVTLSVSGLGTGLTGRFSRNPVTSSDWTATLTVTAGCNAARGPDSFKVTGTGGGASASASATVVVKGFDVEVTPETADLPGGTSVDYQVPVRRDSGFSSNVTLSVSSLPTGVTGAFSTNPTGDTSTLTLTATATATLGSDPFTVTGTAHGCTETDTGEVVVLAAPAFSVSTKPETATLQQGNSVQYTVTVSPETGFTSDVTLSISSLPAGVTGVFSPNPVNAASATPWTSILTLTAAPDAAAGTANFSVTGDRRGSERLGHRRRRGRRIPTRRQLHLVRLSQQQGRHQGGLGILHRKRKPHRRILRSGDAERVASVESQYPLLFGQPRPGCDGQLKAHDRRRPKRQYGKRRVHHHRDRRNPDPVRHRHGVGPESRQYRLLAEPLAHSPAHRPRLVQDLPCACASGTRKSRHGEPERAGPGRRIHQPILACLHPAGRNLDPHRDRPGRRRPRARRPSSFRAGSHWAASPSAAPSPPSPKCPRRISNSRCRPQQATWCKDVSSSLA